MCGGSHTTVSVQNGVPPQIIQQSLLLAVCMTSPTMVTPAEEGSIASRSYTSGWLTHSLSTLTLNSHSHSHTCCESTRVVEYGRTEEHTYY